MNDETPKQDVFRDPSVSIFISTLNQLLQEETFDYTFYDFPKKEMKVKNKMYTIIENFKNDNTSMKNFCEVVNKQLVKYDVSSITNILCGKTYKHPTRRNGANDGYFYSFTVICKRKGLNII